MTDMTKEKEQKIKDFKDRWAQMNEKFLRLKIRAEQLDERCKALDLEVVEMEKMLRDRMRCILKDSPYMLHYFETGKKLY